MNELISTSGDSADSIHLQYVRALKGLIEDISNPSYVHPLLDTPLEQFISPVVRCQFYLSKKEFMSCAPQVVAPLLLASPLDEDRALAASADCLSAEQIRELSNDASKTVLASLVMNPHVPEDVALLMTSKVPVELARSPYCPPKCFEVLADNKSPDVRITVAENIECNMELRRMVLIKCASDRSAGIRQRVVENDLCDRKILQSVISQKKPPTRGSTQDLLLAIANHSECLAEEVVEIFLKISQDCSECWISEHELGKYDIVDVHIDLMRNKACPTELFEKWASDLISHKDDRYALEVALLPNCPPDLLSKIVKKLKASRSKHIAARLGEDREMGLNRLRESVSDKPVDNQFQKNIPYELNDDLIQQAHSGKLRAMVKVWRHAESPQDLKIQMKNSFVDELMSPPNYSQLSKFPFVFTRQFSPDRKNPLLFLRVVSATDLSDIKKSARSKNWLERATVCYCKASPPAVINNLKSDSNEIVRKLANQVA